MEATWSRWARAGLWLIPVYALLTLLGTVTHQPDPSADFAGWSEYVTTARFYASHIGASILGLSLGTLGVVSLGLLASAERRPRAALAAVALHVVGAGPVIGMFGVAAFVQPAMGRAFLDGETAATGWYAAVFETPATLVPALLGVGLFSAASIVLGWALAGHPRVPRWAAIAYGASAPLIGLLGVAVGLLQTVGSVALLASGIVIARRLGRASAQPAHSVAAPEREQPIGRA